MIVINTLSARFPTRLRFLRVFVGDREHGFNRICNDCEMSNDIDAIDWLSGLIGAVLVVNWEDKARAPRVPACGDVPRAGLRWVRRMAPHEPRRIP